ncbi:MAG: SGNH/GDSL hydrolase family protein [Clostridia bacterium]|jgi:lysophospholipase L1-like esterase|nr:SGNH/GDSL hydrolase family protein [Clostridia bacterium]
MKRILIFGDSIMRGVYYSEEAGRHKLYGERLAELKEAGYEVKNCSIMGATVETGLDLIKKRLTVPADETTVLFEYGGNDCDFRWADISGDPTGTFSPNTPLERFTELYGEVIRYAKDMGASVKLCNLVPLDSERYMKWITRNLSYENILGWLGDSSMLYRWHEYYNRTAEKIAEKFGCPLIDIRSPFLLSHNYTNLLSPDGIHPNIEGHRLIDRLLAEAVA